jgi:hypothetical protein
MGFFVEYYVIETDWDESLNSPWDALWDDLPYDALGCLDGSLPLAAVWKSPRVTLETRAKRPDVFGFVLHYAVTEAVRDLIGPIVGEESEFLPLEVPEVGPLYVIHPLWPVEFDDRADVGRNEVSGNISVVRKYSFTLDPDRYDGQRHLFRMLQAKGSAGRDHGCTLSRLIVSGKIKSAADKAGIRGIVFKHVCSA